METAIFELCGERELNPRRTFDCGQCFRWNEDETGRWRGVASGKAAVVWAEEGRTYIECALEDIYFWRDYLDMDTDYDDARRTIEVCDYLRDCAAYGEGIRILRQDRWEALCSFIISGAALVRVIFNVCLFRSAMPLLSYNALFVPIFAMAGLLCLVMSALFRQAAEMKAENDLTI